MAGLQHGQIKSGHGPLYTSLFQLAWLRFDFFCFLLLLLLLLPEAPRASSAVAAATPTAAQAPPYK
jgi:hypothetical protein